MPRAKGSGHPLVGIALGKAFVENHPRRCRAIRKRVPGSPRCYHLAAHGSNYCRFHGGNNSKKGGYRSTRRAQYHELGLRNAVLTRFYSKELGPTLSEAVSRFLDTPVPAQQLSLWEELAIMRHTATHAVEMYRSAVEQHAKVKEAHARVVSLESPDESLLEQLGAALDKTQDALNTAIVFMRDACKEVSDVAAKAARVEAQVQASSGVITPAQVGLIVDQILRCAQEAFGGKKTVELDVFKQLVRENVKMPRTGADGTDLTPDMDVRAMAATIPALPDEKEDEDADV